MLAIGMHAPDFSLPDQNGQLQHFSALKGEKYTVIFFYPKDHTPGCTAQSCSFRDNYTQFSSYGAKIIGISRDPWQSHKKFAEDYHLPFVLLSDSDGAVSKKFDVKKTLGIFPERATFVIDKRGIVRYAFSSQFQVEQHIDGALEVVKNGSIE